MSYLKQNGVVRSVFSGRQDRDILTCIVAVDFEGSTQGFGALAFSNEEISRDFMSDLCAVFELKNTEYKKLIGRPCTVYRCFDRFSAAIEAIGPQGSDKKFILTVWQWKHYPDTLDPLQQALENHQEVILHLRRRLAEETQRMLGLQTEYTPVE